MKKFIENFEVVGVIGNPQQSRVFLVEERESRTKFALKALPMDFFDSEREFRAFEQVVDKVRQFKCPNLVAHYKLMGKYTEPFLLTEFVEGTNLKGYVDEQTRPFPEMLGIAIQILKGIQYLHHFKLLHQNLKATNVLLDTDLNVKLSDFFFSKLFNRWRKRRGFTSLEAVRFISPEQIREKSLDERSDIYSIGIVLFYLFTKVMPIRGTSVSEVMQKHLKMSIKEIPTVINPEVPEEISRIVMEMLKKKPRKRLDSLSELILDLSRMDKGFQKHMSI
jgi:serine/threonine protein kinase